MKQESLVCNDRRQLHIMRKMDEHGVPAFPPMELHLWERLIYRDCMSINLRADTHADPGNVQRPFMVYFQKRKGERDFPDQTFQTAQAVAEIAGNGRVNLCLIFDGGWQINSKKRAS